MARKIVAGNWKMNLESKGAFNLIVDLNESIQDTEVRVIVFPPSLYILPISKMKTDKFEVGAQNFHEKDFGAYTGEVSINQIKSVGGTIGLIGHSERRMYFGETNEVLKAKVDQAIEENFEFIFCCGEPLEEREQGNETTFVKKQLTESLFHLTGEEIQNKIIAYEPVWAIGTGKTATSNQAEAMHTNIRQWLADHYSDEIADSISILYGGSCKPSNAEELFSCQNVNGGLIGGASLKASDFCAIIDAF